MSGKSNKRKFLFDCILIGTLLCIGLSALFILRACSQVGTKVRVWVDNAVVAEYPLSVDGEYSINGGTNVLEIKDGAARVIYADCPKQVCVKRGRISREYERIVCSHNKVEIDILAE